MDRRDRIARPTLEHSARSVQRFLEKALSNLYFMRGGNLWAFFRNRQNRILCSMLLNAEIMPGWKNHNSHYAQTRNRSGCTDSCPPIPLGWGELSRQLCQEIVAKRDS